MSERRAEQSIGVGLASAFLSLAPDIGGDGQPVHTVFGQGAYCAKPVDFRLLCRQRESRPCTLTDLLRICQPFRVDLFLFTTLLLALSAVSRYRFLSIPPLHTSLLQKAICT